MDALVKKEVVERTHVKIDGVSPKKEPAVVIQLSSSSDSSSTSSSDSDSDVEGGSDAVLGKRRMALDVILSKKIRLESGGAVPEVTLPAGFLNALPPAPPVPALPPSEQPSTSLATAERAIDPVYANGNVTLSASWKGCKQFWKAGDYEGASVVDWQSVSGGIDHVRVHPKFLHSNATSHKWALGAFAELLDNSLDEVCNGATYVNVDVLENKKDKSKMLLIEDNGGGMNPDRIRQCMSLGYSAKSKAANTIGQYGNGFKTSTMRLGADAIVFSRCRGEDGKRPTQSIGLLSYTFLRNTGQEDIIVPMLDYERVGGEWNKIVRSSFDDWERNVETIVQWSPFSTEVDLVRQFTLMRDQGTRVIIYNLWEDDEGQLELDFNADPHDIQLRGVNREDKDIELAKEFPNSRHFLTYRHSLRSYTSILYLRLPPGFRIILRGKDVEHHNVVNDMMLSQRITYRPQSNSLSLPKDSISNMSAIVTIGFVKDAKHHIDVQGFNVYHKNRLIKPFWRLWNAAGSDGRGVIGVLEANFVEPAHDKQGFERTTALARLEMRLIHMQKNYWYANCHLIGYAPRRNKKVVNGSANRATSPDYSPHAQQLRDKYSRSGSRTVSSSSDKCNLPSFRNQVHNLGNGNQKVKTMTKSGMRVSSSDRSSPSMEEVSDEDVQITPQANVNSQRKPPTKKASGKVGHANQTSLYHRDTEPQQNCQVSDDDVQITPQTRANSQRRHSEKKPIGHGGQVNQTSSYVGDAEPQQDCLSKEKGRGITTVSHGKVSDNILVDHVDSESNDLEKLKVENRELRRRLEKKKKDIQGELLQDLLQERDRCKSLEAQLQEAQQKIQELNKEQESLIDIFSEERERRDKEEENLRNRLKDASNTIQELLDKIKLLEKLKSPYRKA